MSRLPLSFLFLSVLLFLLLDGTLTDSLQEGMRDLHSHFSLSLYQSVSSGLNQTNLIVSPLSVALSLGLLQLGARGNTLAQLEETLGYNVQDPHVRDFLLFSGSSLNSSEGVKLLQTCSLLVHSSVLIQRDFLHSAASWFNVNVVQANLNQSPRRDRPERRHDEPWPLSGGSSSGELSGSGDPQPSDSPWWPSRVQMALVNTVSFRGTWQKQFVFTHTQNLPFLLSDGTTIKVPMMHQASDVRFGQFRAGSEQRYTVLELPYLGQSLSLQLVLPSDRRSPLGPLEEQLGPRHLWSWDAGLRRTRMDIFIPRFKMQNRFNLKTVLPVMGISDAFNPSTADFSRISEEGLYVSDAFHDVRIEVTEDGTKAAAATAMVLLKRSRAPVFKADRPFLFLLRHSKTGSILFMGRVMNPVDQSS
ncbi:probable serpin E3 [Boleophthalmus pectinirostris]|uniref:probable serpin E3 n=1 Tax=Boleophthalmus pectinirostris TaxID=150288 RepID=UPI002430F671|nr:probable serpin E3 [Boleophthalmus pectinirostris]